MSSRGLRLAGAASAAALLILAGWRASLVIPEKIRSAEKSMVEAAAGYGLAVRYDALKFHLLHLHVSVDNLAVQDALAGVPLGGARSVDLTLSPIGLLRGGLPVSRVRVRDFRFEAGERNRALYEKLSTARREGGAARFPEILLLGGSVRLDPPGPLRRFAAGVREIRIREEPFLGTHVTASLERATGELALPGEAAGGWPFPSVDTEFFWKDGVVRLRKFRTSGGPGAIRISGTVDTRKRTGSGKASGELDVASWIAAGAPGAAWLRLAAREGNVEFSASAGGPWNDPEGTARVVYGNGKTGRGKAGAEAEVSVRGRVVSLVRARANLWGGGLEASGAYAVDSGRAEGKADLRRVSLAEVPWAAFGVPWRPSGTGDVSLRAEGGRGRYEARASLSFPAGLEAAFSAGQERFSLRFPLSIEGNGSVSNEWEVDVASFRVRAGSAEARGSGGVSIPRRTFRLRGDLAIPEGRASDFGIGFPLAWSGIAGEWELSGPWTRPGTAASLRASALAYRALPPLPLAVKIEGAPAEAVHFVADVPSAAFQVTAVGTVLSPADPPRTAADFTVSARRIDLSEAARWVSAVSSSLGSGDAGYSRHLTGVTGEAEADARIGVAPGRFDASGTLRAPRIEVRGIPLRSLRAGGEYKGLGEAARWDADAQGRFGAGSFRVAAAGGAKSGVRVDARVDGVEIPEVFSLLRRNAPAGLKGTVSARFEAKPGPRGWEVPAFSAVSDALSVGGARVSGVRSEGNLGAVSGKFSLHADSPGVRIDGEVERAEGWPVKLALKATGVPTAFLAAAAGRDELPSGGTWSVEAGAAVRLGRIIEGRPFAPEDFSSLHGSVEGSGLSFDEIRFGEIRASGRSRGERFEGEVVTRFPDSRLSWSVSLREPFGFRMEGPFALGDAGNGPAKNGGRRFSARGRVQIEGAVRAIGKTTGTLFVDTLSWRDGGVDLTGKDLTARLDPGGIRWAGGTVVAAGNPVRISGKVSWDGDLDVRLEGKLPAASVRLAVPGVFDRLDGTMSVEARVTGNRDAPAIVGTGRLEGGTLSFLGYNQLFEGIVADAVLSREKIVFEHFEGKSGGGYFDGWGEVPLKMDAGQRLYFSVDFLDMRYPYPEEFRPVVQGHVELIGPVDDLLVTGDVEVQSARYSKTLRPEKALLDFGRRLIDVSARREKSDFRVRLDINGIADETIRIRNNLADASAKGEFRIVGDTSRVIVLGSFDVTEGKVEYRGNRYDVKRATVDFQDPRRNNPRIDARAETRKGNVTVTVSVTGTLEKYEVDLTSDPPLGKNDLVSLLSLGVTTQALAGQEGTVGSAAAASIALGPYKGGVEEGIRGAVGLDRFAIEPGFSSTTKTFEPKFIVGKSFGDRATVSVSTSVGTSAESTATAEVKVRENVFLQGAWESSATSPEGSLGADLKFRYRYRQWKDFLRGKE